MGGRRAASGLPRETNAVNWIAWSGAHPLALLLLPTLLAGFAALDLRIILVAVVSDLAGLC